MLSISLQIERKLSVKGAAIEGLQTSLGVTSIEDVWVQMGDKSAEEGDLML